MNIMQLRYFIKTAELLNYSRAAEELLIARQSLRQSIAALEDELGKPLFVKERNHLSLTEYGEYLCIAGQEAVDAFDRMERGLSKLLNRRSKLSIGFSTTLDPFILPNTDLYLRSFRARFPDVQLSVAQMMNDDVIRAVTEGQLDAGFVLQMPAERKNCRMHVLTEFDVALDHSDPEMFGGKREVEVADLQGVSCLGMGELAVTMAPLWERCQAENVSFPYRVVSDTLDAFYQMKHTKTVGFDILKTDVPEFSWDRTSVLKGFRWEVGLLESDACGDPSLLRLFFRYMEQAYANHWDQYERHYCASSIGFNQSETL